MQVQAFVLLGARLVSLTLLLEHGVGALLSNHGVLIVTETENHAAVVVERPRPYSPLCELA